MPKPLRITYADRKSILRMSWTFIAVIGVLIGLCWIALFFARGHRPTSYSQNDRDALLLISTLGGFLMLLFGALPLTMKPYFGKGAILTDDGMGALENDEISWFVRWEDFGGYQAVTQGPSKGRAIEILNRSGKPVGKIPLLQTLMHPNNAGSSSNSAYKHLVFASRLNSRVPEGCPRIVRREPKERPPQSALATAFKFLASAIFTDRWRLSTSCFRSSWPVLNLRCSAWILGR